MKTLLTRSTLLLGLVTCALAAPSFPALSMPTKQFLEKPKMLEGKTKVQIQQWIENVLVLMNAHTPIDAVNKLNNNLANQQINALDDGDLVSVWTALYDAIVQERPGDNASGSRKLAMIILHRIKLSAETLQREGLWDGNNPLYRSSLKIQQQARKLRL